MRIWVWFILLLALPCLAVAEHTSLVKVDKATLREKPSKASPVVAELTPYQPVTVLESQDGYTKVKTTLDQTGWVASSTLSANAFVFVDTDQINVRRGPGSQYEVLMNYGRKFPLRVIDTDGKNWLMVMDFDGDRGWINTNMVNGTTHYVITREDKVNVRKGMGIGQELAYVAEKGVILEALEEKDGWLRVKHADGDEGWLSAKTVFGWNDVDPPKGNKDKKTANAEDNDKDPSSKAEEAKDDGKKTAKAEATEGESKKSSKTEASEGETKKKASDGDDEEKVTRKKSTKKSSDSDEETKSTSKKSRAATTAKKSSSSDDDDDKPVTRRHKKKASS